MYLGSNYASVYFVVVFLAGAFILLNLLLAILIDTVSRLGSLDTVKLRPADLRSCLLFYSSELKALDMLCSFMRPHKVPAGAPL